MYGRKRKAYKQLVQKKKNYEQNARIGVLLDSMNNPKYFWGEIKKYRRRTCTKNGMSQDDWTDDFCKVFNEISQVHTENETDDQNVDESYDDILDADKSEMEVKKALQHLKCSKAAGPDGILAEMIKTAEHEITAYVTQVKGCQCTIATNIAFKGRDMWMFFGWRYTRKNSLAQFRMGVSPINLHRRLFSTTDNTTCPFCANQQETEIQR